MTYTILVVTVLSLGGWIFYRKHYLYFELVCEIPVVTSFRPDAYVFFHSKNDLDRYFNLNENTKEYKRLLPNVDFNFKEYSYCIVYGRKIEQIWYSNKSTYFDDKSASYAKPKGRIPVFITYEVENKDMSNVYLYKMEKDKRLRGFLGI